MAGKPVEPFPAQRRWQTRVKLERQVMVDQDNVDNAHLDNAHLDNALEQALDSARIDTDRMLVTAGADAHDADMNPPALEDQALEDRALEDRALEAHASRQLEAMSGLGNPPDSLQEVITGGVLTVERGDRPQQGGGALEDQLVTEAGGAVALSAPPSLVAKVSGVSEELAQRSRQVSLQVGTAALKKTRELGSVAAKQSQKIGVAAAQKTQELGTVAATAAVQRTRAMGWKAFLWAFVLGAGATGVGAGAWLLSLPPVPDCKQIQPFSPDTDQLYCAELAARSGNLDDLMAGLNLVKDWGGDHPMRGRAKGLMETWTNAVMGYAREKANKDDLDGAIAMAKGLPTNAPNHKEILAQLQGWEDFLKRGKVLDKAVQTALKKQDFGLAQAKILEISLLESGYWNQRLTDLRRQMYEEMQAVRRLDEARKVVKQNPGTVAALGQAMLLVKQVNPETYLRATADKEAKGWERAFVGIVTKYLGQSNWAGVEASVQLFPTALDLPTSARDALWISRAQPIGKGQALAKAMPEQISQIWAVYPRIAEIDKNSPLRAQAQGLMPNLSKQAIDLNQLQIAEWVASLGPIPALQAALYLGDDVKPGNLHHKQAKTLLTNWQAQIELIEDRPHLLVARELGKTGKIPGLKAGIAQAQKIRKGRSLRLEGQSIVAEYTKKIQIIEDTPILAKAQDLANQGRLGDAIREAEKVKSGRALYWDAQGMIGQWIAQIQIAEDRPILNAAEALASQGSLTAAIAEASRIGSGRALYWEAQGSISRWAAQREAILNPRPAAPSRTYPEPSAEDSYPPMESQPYDDPAPSPDPVQEAYPEPAADPAPPEPAVVVPTEEALPQ
jgi:hypothetical protein